MKENNIVQEKSYAFALNVIKTYQIICSEKKEYVLSKQFLRSGTSVGANVEEAIGGQTKKDFFMPNFTFPTRKHAKHTIGFVYSEIQDICLPNKVRNYLPMPMNCSRLLVPS